MIRYKTLALYLFAQLFFVQMAKADLIDEDEVVTKPVMEEATQADPNIKNMGDSESIENPTKPKNGDGNGSHKIKGKVKEQQPPKKGESSSKAKSSLKSSNHAREPVHFESKGLKGLRDKGLVELMDDVVVTQGPFRLEADKAKIFFDEAAHDVIKVVAEGNVKIFNIDEKTGEKLKAYGNQMVFLNRDRRVIMEGNARVWRGEDSVIRGKKITYEMDTGWIRADRVAGELTPSEKDKK